MNRRIVGLIACAVLPASVFAEPFEEARVTETINIVSLLRQLNKPQPAAVGDVIKGQTALKTGGESRAELKFPDLTITRVGANSLFRFYAGGRDMTLDGGTMLFYSPKGEGGGKVQAGAVTAAVTGSAFMVMNLSPVIKVICLDHAVAVSGPGFIRTIRKGQVIDQTGKVTNIDLAALARSSNLVNGFSTPLPFAFVTYRREAIQNLNLDTTNDQAQITRRTIAANQTIPTVNNQPVHTVAGAVPPPVVTSSPPPRTFTPPSPPTPEPTPRHHKPRKPPRPPQEMPGEGGEQGGGNQQRGR
jgi:FecR-like protein